MHAVSPNPAPTPSLAPLPPPMPPPHTRCVLLQVAEEVETQLQKYKAAVDEINAKTGGDHADGESVRGCDEAPGQPVKRGAREAGGWGKHSCCEINAHKAERTGPGARVRHTRMQEKRALLHKAKVYLPQTPTAVVPPSRVF